jgi:hypothetical protein
LVFKGGTQCDSGSINNSSENIRFHIEGFKKHLSKLGLIVEMQEIKTEQRET